MQLCQHMAFLVTKFFMALMRCCVAAGNHDMVINGAALASLQRRYPQLCLNVMHCCMHTACNQHVSCSPVTELRAGKTQSGLRMPAVRAALLGMQGAITCSANLSWCSARCAGSIPTEVNFDIRGVSPVSAQSPLAPAVTKLWNSPNPYYMQDYTINGVRWLPCQWSARMAGPSDSSPRVCGVFPSRGRSAIFPRVRDPGALDAPDP